MNTHLDLDTLNSFTLLFDGLSATEFFDKYWRKNTLLISRDDPSVCKTLLDGFNLDELMCSRFLHEGSLRIFKDEKKVPFHTFSRKLEGIYNGQSVVHPAKAYSFYNSGHTLIFQNVHMYDDPMGRLVRHLEKEMQVGARANIYVTPPHSRGFGKHWDHLCSIIFQLEGEKEWEVYDSQVENPHPACGPNQSTNHDPELLFKTVLKPGDLLYIPKGFAHSPKTNQKHSVHVNIAFKPFGYDEIVNEFVKQLVLTKPEIRAGIHPFDGPDTEYLNSAIPEALAEFDWHKAHRRLHINSTIDSRPIYSEWHRQPTNLEAISQHQEYCFAESMQWSFSTRGSSLLVQANGLQVKLPAHHLPNIEALFQFRAGQISLSDLPGGETSAKTELLSDLVRIGVLYIPEGKEA